MILIDTRFMDYECVHSKKCPPSHLVQDSGFRFGVSLFGICALGSGSRDCSPNPKSEIRNSESVEGRRGGSGT